MTVTPPTGTELRHVLSYAATALGASGDNGDRYAAAQIAAVLGVDDGATGIEPPTVEGITLDHDERTDNAGMARARRYAVAIADSAAAHGRIDQLVEDLTTAEFLRDAAEHQLSALEVQVEYAGTTLITVNDGPPAEAVNALLDLSSCDVWVRADPRPESHAFEMWVRHDVTSNPMQYAWPLDGTSGPFVPIAAASGVASTMATINRLHQREADVRRLLWNRPTGSRTSSYLEGIDETVGRVLTAIDHQRQEAFDAHKEALALIHKYRLLGERPDFYAPSHWAELDAQAIAVRDKGLGAVVMTQQAANGRAARAARRLEDATEAVWGVLGPGGAEDLSRWITHEHCERVARALLDALD